MDCRIGRLRRRKNLHFTARHLTVAAQTVILQTMSEKFSCQVHWRSRHLSSHSSDVEEELRAGGRASAGEGLRGE